MSSHHFVKEDQEPALVIVNASGIPFRIVEQLLEWSPTILVFENALEAVLSWGIDIVLSRQDRVKEHMEKLIDQIPVKIISYREVENPLHTALYFLAAGKYRAVNIIGVETSELADFTDRFNLVVFASVKRWSFARNGKFEKWLTKGTSIETKAITDTGIYSKQLDEKNTVQQDGLVQITSSAPFWVGEVYAY